MILLFKSIHHALEGILCFLLTERNGKIECMIACVLSILAWYMRLSALEWCIQLICIGLVIGAELINTAIEELCNHISPKHHPQIGLIKDLAAGAVLFVSILASIVGIILYYSKVSAIIY